MRSRRSGSRSNVTDRSSSRPRMSTWRMIAMLVPYKYSVIARQNGPSTIRYCFVGSPALGRPRYSTRPAPSSLRISGPAVAIALPVRALDARLMSVAENGSPAREAISSMTPNMSKLPNSDRDCSRVNDSAPLTPASCGCFMADPSLQWIASRPPASTLPRCAACSLVQPLPPGPESISRGLSIHAPTLRCRR